MTVRDQREARARKNKHAHKGVDIPSCPGVLAQLMDELRQPQVSGKHIATLIGKDVGLAAIVVRSANSPPSSAAGGRIASIDDAIRLLGFGMLANLVQEALLRSAIADPGRRARALLGQLALHRRWPARCWRARTGSPAPRPPTPSACSTTAASRCWSSAFPNYKKVLGHGQPGHRTLVHRRRGRGARHQPRHHRLHPRSLLGPDRGACAIGILCHHDYSVFTPDSGLEVGGAAH